MMVGIILLLSGCAFLRGEVGEPFSEDRIVELQKGKSTRQDVAQHFGAPDEIVQANGYEIFITAGSTVNWDGCCFFHE